MVKGSNIELKKVNRNNIYKLICSSERIAKADIAGNLGISFPTVTQNLKELMGEGLVMENGDFKSTGGRKAKGLSAVWNAKAALGIDLTQNHISIVVVNLKGDVINSIRERLPFTDSDSYYEAVGTAALLLLASNGITHEKILGAGISVPAIVADDKKTIDYVSLVNIPADFYLKISEHIPFPCNLYNDSNAGGYAEQWKLKSADMLYVSLSNSVGGAIISNHEIIHGKNQRSGEFGHMMLVPGGRKCYCGKLGCMDAYCAAHLLSDATEGSLEAFFEKVDAGEEKYLEIWNEYLEYLSCAIHNLRMCFDYDIVLGGYLGEYIGQRMERLKEKLQEKNMFEKATDYVKACYYTREAAAVGCALYYIEVFIDSI